MAYVVSPSSDIQPEGGSDSPTASRAVLLSHQLLPAARPISLGQYGLTERYSEDLTCDYKCSTNYTQKLKRLSEIILNNISY